MAQRGAAIPVLNGKTSSPVVKQKREHLRGEKKEQEVGLRET